MWDVIRTKFDMHGNNIKHVLHSYNNSKHTSFFFESKKLFLPKKICQNSYYIYKSVYTEQLNQKIKKGV